MENIIPQKRCPHCLRSFPPTTEFFNANKNKADGLSDWCKECRNLSHRKQSLSEGYKGKAHNTQAGEEIVPDGYKQCQLCRSIKVASKECFHISKTASSGLHPLCKECRSVLRRKRPIFEPVQEGYKRCPQCNQEKPATPDYFINNNNQPGGLHSYCKECWKQRYHSTEQHREYDRKCAKRYRLRHPERMRIFRRAYQVRLYNAEGHHTEKDIKAQYKQQDGKCYYCKKVVGKHYHVDHVVPLSRGGSNDPSNLVIACHTCNESKGNKLLHEWKKGGRLL